MSLFAQLWCATMAKMAARRYRHLRNDGFVSATLVENRLFSTLSRLKVCATMATMAERRCCATMKAFAELWVCLRNIGRKQAFFDFQLSESLRNYGRDVSATNLRDDDGI